MGALRNMDMTTPLLSTKDAARMLGVTPQWVRKLVERGDLPATAFAHMLAFKRADVERMRMRPRPGRPRRRRTE